MAAQFPGLWPVYSFSVPGEDTVMTAQGGLAGWAERSALRRASSLAGSGPVPGRLRFVFYGRVSTEDWQDPVTSRARQRENQPGPTASPRTAAGTAAPARRQ